MLASVADENDDSFDSNHNNHNHHSSPSASSASWTDPDLVRVLAEAEPHNYFLTKVTGIDDDRFNSSRALSMKDILSPLLGTLESSVQFNYCIDIDWMMSQVGSSFGRT